MRTVLTKLFKSLFKFLIFEAVLIFFGIVIWAVVGPIIDKMVNIDSRLLIPCFVAFGTGVYFGSMKRNESLTLIDLSYFFKELDERDKAMKELLKSVLYRNAVWDSYTNNGKARK